MSKRVTSTDMDGNALSLRSIVCAEELLDVLRQSIVGNPTPIMLIGEEGSGKHYIAMRLAAALLCDEPDDKDGACGSCPSCRSLAQGEHFDLIELKPEEGKKTIAVANVREQVGSTLHIFPQLSRRRVYIIFAIKDDTLNEQGQNALLKPLEEHPEFVRFILLTEDPERLLPTIRSRSRMIHLGRRSDQDMRAILEHNGETDSASVELAVLYAEGLPGQALAIAGDKDFQELRRETFDFFLSLFHESRVFALTGWQRLLQNRDEKIKAGTKLQKHERIRMNDVLRLLESFSRDLLILKEKIPQGKLVNSDLEKSLSAVLEKYPATDPLRAALLIQQTSRALSANVLFDHAVARLMLGLRHYLSGQAVPNHVYLHETLG